MLLQQSQVGREQAAEKEGAALQASMKGAADQQRLEETKESVRRPQDDEVASRAVSDRGGSGQGGSAAEGGEKEKTGGDEAPAAEIVKDPDLGKRVDLSG